jgi:hypothetical protein
MNATAITKPLGLLFDQAALRTLISEPVKIASKKEPGGSFRIPFKHWGYATEYVSGACGRTDMSPEDYLRRVFLEAALMYESASLGSMVRITATKGKLTATFGVDVKRMSYFFRDRDVVLNAKGSTARIFHIVRAHVRKNGTAVPMHFRGLKAFEWAGQKINITVPGRDHFHLSEFDVAHVSEDEIKEQKEKLSGRRASRRPPQGDRAGRPAVAHHRHRAGADQDLLMPRQVDPSPGADL